MQYVKRYKFLIIVAVIILAAAVITFTLTQNQENNDITAQGEGGDEAGVVAHVSSAEQTLTISLPAMHEFNAATAGEDFTRQMAENGIQLHLEFDLNRFTEADDPIPNILSNLAAGTGADVYLWDLNFFPLHTFLENGFLADIYAVMAQNDGFNRDDFFTNVLEAHEINGGLYTIPINFNFDYVSVSSNAPPEFTNDFLSLSYITVNQMLAMHHSLATNHNGFEDFFMLNGFSSWLLFLQNLGNFMSFDNGTANVQTESLADFLSSGFLAEVQRSFDEGQNSGVIFVSDSLYEELESLAEIFMFSRVPIDLSIGTYYVSDRDVFSSRLPIADNNGHLVSHSTMSASINAAADQGLAWGYINALMLSHLNNDHTAVPSILRVGDTPYQSAAVSIAFTDFNIPADVFRPYFDGFIRDGISAEDTAANMQNAVALRHGNEPEIVELPEPEEDLDLPIITLTVQIPAVYINVFEQAASTLNAHWAATIPAEERYLLQLQIDSFNDHNHTAMQNTNYRLQVELMAGQGPDLFVYNMQPLRSYAAAGFIRDIYQLIDNDPNLSREDFYTNALEAFEIGGGLYMLPMSFGFGHTAINANLPQQYIDRFSQFDTISLEDILSIALDLNNSQDDFGHLALTDFYSILSLPTTILDALMRSYIDFDALQADFNAPSFIASVQRVADIFETNFTISGTGGLPFRPVNAILRPYADSFMFVVEDIRLDPISAFFEHSTEYFVNHRPMTDAYGRLLIVPYIPIHSGSDMSSNWASICITAAGDEQLAWEFTQHLIRAFTMPEGAALRGRQQFLPPHWGHYSLATPILRSLFDDHMQRAFENAFDFIDQHHPQNFAGVDDQNERNRQIQAAVNRIAQLNEMPMILSHSHVPPAFYQDNLNLVIEGIMPAADFATHLQNSVFLWLLEME